MKAVFSFSHQQRHSNKGETSEEPDRKDREAGGSPTDEPRGVSARWPVLSYHLLLAEGQPGAEKAVRDTVERRQTSVIIEARPKVLLGAAGFIFYMGVKVGKSQQELVKKTAAKVTNAVFEEKYRVDR